MKKELSTLLFINENGIEKKKVMSFLSIDEDQLAELIKDLRITFFEIGYDIVETDRRVALSTTKNMEDFVKKYKDSTFTENIGRGSRETLSIIMYLGPVSKSDIDFIRGVNSQSILNQLIVRGFIDKENVNRISYYRPTIDLLSYLGVNTVQELSDFDKIKSTLTDTLKNIKESDEKEF